MFQDTIILTLMDSISALYASDCIICATKLLTAIGVPIHDLTLLECIAAVYVLYGMNCKAYAEVVTNELLDSGIIDILNSIL
jgi:hypothetical protein